MDFDAIQALMREDMRATDRLIEEKLYSEVALVNRISAYIIHSGGKRLRPLLVLLGSRLFGPLRGHHIALAAVIEFIHTATLLHDDVVDASALRRGQETANAVWGNDASVLVGDFLYSRAFQMMVEVGNLPVMRILADTTNVIAEGEVMQLLHCHEPDITEARYFSVIQAKTAKLFEAATQIGAVLAGCSEEERHAMARFGRHFGTGYQLVDDMLDYQGAVDEIGKDIGDDLAQGKATLPLIRAMQVGTKAQADYVRVAIREGRRDDIERIIDTVESTGAIAYTAAVARSQADEALRVLAVLPASPYRDALAALTEFSVRRTG